MANYIFVIKTAWEGLLGLVPYITLSIFPSLFLAKLISREWPPNED